MTQRSLGVLLAPLLALLGVLMFADVGRSQDTEPSASPAVKTEEAASDSAASMKTGEGAEEDEEAEEAEEASKIATTQGNMDALWTCLAAFLVFFMQAGFALVETGFTRAKKRVQHHHEEPDGLFPRILALLVGRVWPDVRCQLQRPDRPAISSFTAWRGPASTNR